MHTRGDIEASADAEWPRRKPRKTASELARAVDDGRGVGDALRYLDSYGSEPEAPVVAEALARFLVARCESHHAGWRVVRQVVVDSSSDAPWEKCARRAIPQVTRDLLDLSRAGGRTPLSRAQHVAAQRRAEEIARDVDAAPVLAALGLPPRSVSSELWEAALGAAVGARSREHVARMVERALRSG